MTPTSDMNDHDLLIRLEAKVDSFINAQTDHEVRLRVVEADREQVRGSVATLKGLVAAIGVIATVAGVIGTWALVVHR